MAYLKECFESIRAQTFDNFEVIIVDDNSDDESFKIALGFAEFDSRFRVFRNLNRLGLVANWNYCLQLCCGNWIKFLFQDDLIANNCLERLVESCERLKRPFGFCDRDIIFDDLVENGARNYFKQHQAMIKEAYGERDYVDAETFARMCSVRPTENIIGEPTVTIFHRSVIQNFGIFNPALIQICDMEYWARVGSNVGVVYIPERLATFRVHHRSTTSHNHAEREYRTGRLDPLIVHYLLLRSPFYRNIRNKLYLRSGRMLVWWQCIYDAHRAWRIARPYLFNSTRGDAKNKKDWKDIIKTYPELKILAFAGLFLMMVRAVIYRTGLDRYFKNQACFSDDGNS
jgi:glycosyltransferase involved in cell wall biosynthesis